MTSQTRHDTAFFATDNGATPARRVEIVFIDGGVADRDSLISKLAPETEVHVLDPAGDGLAQIAHFLAGRGGIDALHFVAHGAQGSIALGTAQLSADSLAGHAASLPPGPLVVQWSIQ